MDFVIGMPKVDTFDSVLVVVDRLSIYAHFIPLRHTFNAASIAQLFIKEIVCLHEIPKSIVSDRDPVFTSIFWEELFKWQGTQLKRRTAYHPQTDGQTKVVNHGLETYIRCFAMHCPTKWVKWLPWAEFSYSTSFHTILKATPFEVVMVALHPTSCLMWATALLYLR